MRRCSGERWGAEVKHEVKSGGDAEPRRGPEGPTRCSEAAGARCRRGRRPLLSAHITLPQIPGEPEAPTFC